MKNQVNYKTLGEFVDYDDLYLEFQRVTNDIKYGMTKTKPKRARTKKGRYKADDKSTKDVNEDGDYELYLGKIIEVNYGKNNIQNV